MREADDFLLRLYGNGLTLAEVELNDAEGKRVTVAETDEQTLRDVMSGRNRPTDAYFSTRLIMDCMKSNLAHNHGLIRLPRRGQEVN